MAGTICLFYSEGIVPCTTLFREKGEALAAELGGGAEFSQFDIDNAAALRAALNGVDLVVHAAGPFQRREECSVLEAALDTNVKNSFTLQLVKGFSGFIYNWEM
jgi:saccharopine dehydrogenase-like NADP-dependent oxidoreductase